MAIIEFFKFGTVGAMGTLVNIAVLFALTEYGGIYYLFSAVCSFIVALVFNFTLNKLWTFGEKFHESTVPKFFKFTTVSLAALCVNLLFLWLFTEVFGVYYILSQVGAIGMAFMINFTGNKLWTFKKDSSSPLP